MTISIHEPRGEKSTMPATNATFIARCIPEAVVRGVILPCLDETADLKARIAVLEQEVKDADERTLAVVNDWRMITYDQSHRGTASVPISYESEYYGCEICQKDMTVRWWADSPLKERCCEECLKEDPWECDCGVQQFGVDSDGNRCYYCGVPR